MIRNGLFFLFLLAASWEDAGKKEIPIWIFWAGGAAALGMIGWEAANGMSGGAEVSGLKLCADRAAGSLLGISLLFCGKLTGGAIGSGDGWFFLVSGWFLGLKQAALLLCGGVWLCGSWALGLFCWNRMHGNENAGKITLPFLPFVTLSWLGMAAAEWMDR